MDIFRILVQLVSTSFGLVYIIILSKWKYPKKIIFTAVAIFIILITILDFMIVKYLSYLMAQYPIYDFLYRFGNTVLLLITARHLTNQRTAQRVFVALAAGVAVFSVDTVAITIRILFGIYPLELLFEFLMYPLMLLLILRCRNSFLAVCEYLQNRLWPLCVVFAVLLICLFSQISVPTPLEQAPGNIPVALMICVIALGIYGILFFLFRTLAAQSQLENNVLAMNLYVSALERQNEIISQNAKKAAMLRHDLRHITNMISTCLGDGDIEGAMELINRLDEGAGKRLDLSVGVYTGHKLMDATITYYINLAKELNIDFFVDMKTMESVKADKAELAVVLANALENAENACRRIPDGEERKIRIRGYPHGNQYFLEVANTCAGQVKQEPVTGRPLRDDGGFGLGSSSIAIFAEKHAAQLEYRFENGWLYLSLLVK